MIMVHSDDTGLVLPPRVASVQVVIIAVEKQGEDEKNQAVRETCERIHKELKEAGIRVEYDDRAGHKSGWKYNHWEQRGVPIRLEVGKKDVEQNEVRCAKRHDGAKSQLKQEGIAQQCKDLLELIHKEMFDKALQARLSHTKEVETWDDFMAALAERHICLAPWCNEQQCEVTVKDRSKEESLAALEAGDADELLLTGSAKTLCLPYKQEPLKEGAVCFHCGKAATTRALWGRSY